jgi:ABC-type transport system substrate-binding protein
VGGLALPEEVPWFLPNSQEPLAYLLAQHLHRSLFDPLTGESELVAAWSMAEEEATFILQPDAAWSDGSPLRAADVVDLLLQAKENGEIVGLSGARVIDFKTLQLILDSPVCPSLMRVARWPIVDVREWPPLRTSNGVNVNRKGRHGWSIESSQPVKEELFEYRTYPDELSLREAYEGGEINSVLGASRLKMGPLQGPQQSSERSGPILASLMFRVADPLIKEVKVREALTLATDRTALFKAAYGTSPPALLTALLPANHWAAPAGETSLPKLGGIEGGQGERAERLLSQAGWQELNEDGVRMNTRGEPLRLTLTVRLSPDQRWEALAKELAVQWREIGVELIPFYVEFYFLEERLHTQRWQIALLAYLVSPEPDQRALWSVASPNDMLGQDMNITGYQNATVAELMKQGAQIPGCEPQKRAAFYHSAWEQLLTDRPLSPLFALPLDEVHRPDVEWLRN